MIRSIVVARAVPFAMAAALVCAAAFAHTILVASDPADGGRLTAPPAAITLSFSQRIEARFSTFTLYEVAPQASVQTVLDGAARLAEYLFGAAEAVNDNTFRLPVASPLPAGHFAILWQVLTVDGHTTSGVVRFAVEKP